MRKIRIQYISDLHLEFFSIAKTIKLLNTIPTNANLCVLAGDIGYPFQKTYEIFLKGMSLKFETILLIHGNHEYYQFEENQGKTMNEIVEKTKEILDKNNLQNIHFLHNSYFDLGPFRFVGSILWTHIYDKRYLSNDYERVYDFSIETMNEEHQKNRRYIESILQQSKYENKKVIMITHHLPSFQLNHSKYMKYKEYHQCFASHCDEFIQDPVIGWIFGHTHTKIDRVINDIPCVSNPIGYPNENSRVSFGDTILFEMDEYEDKNRI